MNPHQRRVRRLPFDDMVRDRLARLLDSDEVIHWDAMKQYLRARVAGDEVGRPVVSKRIR